MDDPQRALSALSLEALRATPNALAASYSRFRVGERLLLTGHSHQAWPDCAFEGQVEAFLDAAEAVDDKWERAERKAERVRRGFADLLGDGDPGLYALGSSTHELAVRFLSALPLGERPRLLSTDGEFHSLRRQLDRLSEEAGLEVVRLAADREEDAATLGERLARAIDDRTAAVLLSAVLFQTGRIVRDLDRVAAAARRHGAALYVDAYHALGAMPFRLADHGLGDAWVTGGGYKYLQLGEGCCFLRVPPGVEARPVVTGWFAEMATLAAPARPGAVVYGRGGAAFAGSTYDPTSHYRAARVLDFFAERRLDPAFLRAVSRHQVSRLAASVDALDLDPRIAARRRQPLAETGGFLVVESPQAPVLKEKLRARGMLTDCRGSRLRLGPAPYLSDRQLDDAVALLGEAVRELSARG